ncbi:hypothetical protein ACSSS7_001907 [Eimeria intestinalis]
MESIESASSCKSLPSLHQFPTGHSACSFRGFANSAESSRSLEEAPLPGDTFRDLRDLLGSKPLLEATEHTASGAPKPWQRLGGRESGRAARSHALLYLALTDPVLSATALLSPSTAKRNCANPCKKEGSALVRSRPAPGATIIAAVPEGVHVDKTRDEEAEFNEGEQAAQADAGAPFATKPMPAVSAAVVASARLTAPEPSGALLGASKQQELEGGGATVEVSLKNVNDTMKDLEPHARMDAIPNLLNLGTYLALHGDTILLVGP